MKRQTNNQFRKIPIGKFRMASKCYVCNGVGLDICPRCNGNKKVNGSDCPECGGRGTVKCYACGGRGIVD